VAFLAFAACSTTSTNPSGASDMSAAARPDLASTSFSCCGHPGDKGNSLGVGQFCDPDPCTGTKATLCATLRGDDKQHFCTFPCTQATGDMGDPCGENATCQCSGGQCGCYPTACTMNPPDGC
jgi:hypothetical protein